MSVVLLGMVNSLTVLPVFLAHASVCFLQNSKSWPTEPQEIVILEVRHRGVAMTEICESDVYDFEALHLADVQTGFVWRSLQWLGPQQGLIDLEIVLPFTGRRG